MPEVLTIEPAPSLWTPAALPASRVRQRRRPTDMVRSPKLPDVRPGQLWCAEIASVAPPPASLAYQTLTSANVVIYDRALAQMVGRFLPLGGYAEPAAPSPPFDAVWSRCLRFAFEGWSVALLIHREREEEILPLSNLLLGRALPADLPVSLFAGLEDGGYEKCEIPLGELAIGDLPDLGQSQLVIIICDVLGGAAAPRLSVASTNGLAG